MRRNKLDDHSLQLRLGCGVAVQRDNHIPCQPVWNVTLADGVLTLNNNVNNYLQGMHVPTLNLNKHPRRTASLFLLKLLVVFALFLD